MTPTPISPAIIGEHEKFLIYGDPKMGKTHCALTIPEPIYFLAIASDNEAKTYYSKPFQDKHGKKEIYIDVAVEEKTSKGTKATGSDHAKKLIEEALEGDANGKGPEFASIIVDNATRLSEFQMNKAIEISHAGLEGGKTESALAKYTKHGILAPFDSDWGAAQSIMRRFTSELFGVDKHLVLIAHEHKDSAQDRKTQTRNIIGVKPLFIGKDRDTIANLFDNVWRFTKEGQFFTARTEPLGSPYTVISGSRISGLQKIPKDYTNPNLSDAIKEYRAYAESIS